VADTFEGRQIVYPETDLQVVLARQLASKSPADSDIPKVVDDPAEKIPGLLPRHVSHCCEIIFILIMDAAQQIGLKPSKSVP
jgi:hypothetical protein